MNNQTIASPRQDIGHRNCQVTESIAAGDVQSTSLANWSQRQTQSYCYQMSSVEMPHAQKTIMISNHGLPLAQKLQFKGTIIL